MNAKIIKIGNSKGIRIPKKVIEQCELKDDVTLQVKDKTVIIAPGKKPREGWSDQFRKLTKNEKTKEDNLKEFRDFSTDWEENEWEW